MSELKKIKVYVRNMEIKVLVNPQMEKDIKDCAKIAMNSEYRECKDCNKCSWNKIPYIGGVPVCCMREMQKLLEV